MIKVIIITHLIFLVIKNCVIIIFKFGCYDFGVWSFLIINETTKVIILLIGYYNFLYFKVKLF